MKPFAELLDRLLYTPQRTVKLALLVDYFRSVPDPDRGWGLAALTGALAFPHAKPALIRELILARCDPVLFGWSYDFVGDLAETVALLWPEQPPAASDRADPSGCDGDLRLSEVVAGLRSGTKAALPALITAWLDRLDATGRWALLKLVTGELRVGASARLAKLALAAYGDVEPSAIEEVWHGCAPPYSELWAWLDGRGLRPEPGAMPVFRPLMLAHPLEAADLARLSDASSDYLAEWKWDGIRVQIAASAAGVRLYSRGGDDITPTFPEIAEAARFSAVLDGELLVMRDGVVAPFNALQQRLNRKAPSAKLIVTHPAAVRLYDLLLDGGEDLRLLPFAQRRQRLEAFIARTCPARMDLSPLVPFTDLAELDRLRRTMRDAGLEGLMLKHKASPYVAGRPKGWWWKWKRDPLTLDVVLMYAQRGHGRRSSFYSDLTFGTWRDGPQQPELVPVGKAYFGFTDAELGRLDSWIRHHTTRRWGPVREVAPGLVLEVAFDAVQRSTRHRSGVAMRFPRVHRIRWDKPADEADRLETLEGLLD